MEKTIKQAGNSLKATLHEVKLIQNTYGVFADVLEMANTCLKLRCISPEDADQVKILIVKWHGDARNATSNRMAEIKQEAKTEFLRLYGLWILANQE